MQNLQKLKDIATMLKASQNPMELIALAAQINQNGAIGWFLFGSPIYFIHEEIIQNDQLYES